MLDEVMRDINNHFAIDNRTNEFFGAEDGEFSLVNGEIEVDNYYVEGQYIAIEGSILNNGVYRVEYVSDGIISLVQRLDDYPEWIRPAGVPTAYNTGDRVRHNNLRWVSLQDTNIVEPGWPGSTGTWWNIIPGVEIENPFTDEDWEGTIYSLRVPYPFLMLVERIAEFTKSREGQASNIVSASFGVQSQSFGRNVNGVRAGWQTVFKQELNKYRRMTPDIII